MPSVADACRSVDVDADIISLTGGGLARMDAHPGSCHRALRPCVRAQGPLGVYRCGNGVADPREGEKARVAWAVDFLTAVARGGGSRDLPVAGRQLRVLIAALLR